MEWRTINNVLSYNFMRLDRHLHESGAGTRREVNLLIRQRRVAVNGVPATDGARHVPAGAVVTLDGLPATPCGPKCILLHKPPGYVTATRDAQATIYDLLPFRPGQILPVGRLDKESEGLLIITDDGQLIHRLTNPARHVEKEYAVDLELDLDDTAIERLRGPLEIGRGETTRPAIAVVRHEPRRATITLDEGKYHQVRRMFTAVGNHVNRLVRIRIANITIEGLPSGAWRDITEVELQQLRAAAGLTPSRR